jgi:hypothetical protein
MGNVWADCKVAETRHPVSVTLPMEASSEERSANASLIAVSPDLLAACEAVLPWVGGLTNENRSVASDYAVLRAAIAKATGAA